MIPPSKPHRYAARTLVEVEKGESECMSRKALIQCANYALHATECLIGFYNDQYSNHCFSDDKRKRVSGIGRITALQRTAQHH